jgi:hypothetical protein
MLRRILFVNAATDKIIGHARPAICATLLGILWKDVERDWIKIIGDGTPKGHNANVEIDKIVGDVITATSAMEKAINANVVIKKKIGDAISVIKIFGWEQFANVEINNDISFFLYLFWKNS